MKSIYTIAVILSLMFCCSVNAQDMEDYMVVDELDTLKYELRLQRYIYKEKYIFEGEAINQYLLPEIPIYAPLKFKTKRQRQRQIGKLTRKKEKGKEDIMRLTENINGISSNQSICESTKIIRQNGRSGNQQYLNRGFGKMKNIDFEPLHYQDT